MKKVPKLYELLAQLVACPSVNPGDSGTKTGPNYGESGMVDLLNKLLKPWADEITIQEVLPGRSNFIARFDGHDKSQSYAFEAHTDTVEVQGMTIEPFTPNIRDGKLYGRGSCDTKGPMAAMLHALLSHLNQYGKPPVTWYFLAPCDEELGGRGAQHLMDSGFRCDGIFVGEPTDYQVIEKHKGALRLRLTVHGKAAHSAYPELGENAIHAASELIQKLELAFTPPKEIHPNESTTISAGIIHGGDQVNRIPDIAEIEIDIRISPQASTESIEKTVDQVIQKIHTQRAGIQIEYKRTQYYPPFELPAQSRLRSKLAPLLENDSASYASVRYATNAGFYHQAGVSCVVYGPGSIAQAHTADEWIELSALENAAALYKNLLQSIR